KCKPEEIPYCITDALIAAAKGDVQNGLLFSGQYGYKAEKIETVKEVMAALFEGLN
ncbi:MAG: nitronate monooxygenase, partial [Acetivibrio sp.]